MAKVLAADDDPQILRLLELVLEEGGHDMVGTSDPREVLHLAAGSGVEAIILDVMMPDVSGYQVMHELRSNQATAEIPVLFLSGLGEGADRVRGLQSGADEYLVKPFEPQELLLRLERLIGSASRPSARLDSGDSPAGRSLGRYEVRDVLGEGAMGTVYRGWDPRLERDIALKTVRLEPTMSDTLRRDLVERLRKEAITIARFNHPHIVSVYDMGVTEDSAFLAMELVDGVSLARFLRERERLAPDEAIPVGAAMASALEAAHGREVIHRDVKPSNVLLGHDGSIKVTDFGLAFIRSAVAEGAAQVYGTPGYVPPEVLHDQPYSQEGDLFGLGATLYEVLAGSNPLVGSTLKDTVLNTMEGGVPDLADDLPGIPPGLSALVMRLLAHEPADRPTARAAHLELSQRASDANLHWSPPPRDRGAPSR